MPLSRLIGKPLMAWLAIFLLWGASSALQGQVVANFNPTKSGGCSPLAVGFANTTTGAGPGATYTWNFGNGNTITTSDSTLPVGATYSIPQIYVVTLTVHSGVQVSTKSVDIIVHKVPTLDFSASVDSGCQPLSTSFSGVGVAGDGFISSYFWDFGDGNTLSTGSANVNKTYIFPGTYTVSLSVTNSFGCSSTLQKKNMITVFPGVTASFTADSTTLCNITDPVQFQNSSTGTAPMTYAWNFGDGTTSNSANPSHQYAAKGTYSVQLTATSPQGCTGSVIKTAYIDVANFNPDFNFSSPSCTGSAIQFTDISSPAPSGNSQWTFGDGQSGSGKTIGHTYLAPGTYSVTLTDKFGACIASQQKNITVFSSPVTNGFLINYGSACQAPMLISFSDTTSSAVKWLWNFTGNPGDTSTQQSPSFLYTQDSIYHPTLTVTNANGCTATVSEPINSAQPTAMIKMDTTLTPSNTICATVTANFSAISPDTLAQYTWTFGDGTTSTSPNPTHLYSIPGTYIINLSFVTNHGCLGTAFPPDTVIVYPKPKALFTALDSMPCTTNETELFTNLDDSSAQFLWIYGDGTSDINNNVLHTHQYHFTGLDTMMLIASSPGCSPDTSVITRFLVQTPVPNLLAANTCDSNRRTVQFSDSTTGGSEYIWSYGDGTSDTSYSFMPTRFHTYAQPGEYNAVLTGYFGACIEQSPVLPVYILNPQHPLLSSVSDSICESSPLPVQLSGLDTNYESVAIGSGTYYHLVNWQYGDSSVFGPQGNKNFATRYNGTLTNLKPGEDSFRVIIQSAYFGCYDTSNFIPIHISGPLASFSAQGTVCNSVPIVFTDSSKPTGGVPIVKWVWNFGDSVSVTRNTNDTVMHVYAFPGNYSPTLTVTDSNGCSGTAQLPLGIVVNGPKADFFWTPAAVTLGTPITFFNSSTAGPGTAYTWHFSSDGFISHAANSLTRTYLTPVIDTIELIASGGFPGGCSDTIFQIINIPKPYASFTDTTDYIDFANCPPMVAYFKSNSTNYDSLHWDFGDGSTAENNPDPSHTYNVPGTYLVTLTAYGAGGTTSVCEDSINVKGPNAILHANILVACVPASDTFHATASLVNTYIWDFGDGTVLSTTDSQATHTYTLPGIFNPHLVITDSTGCEVGFNLGQPVIMDSLHVQLGPDTLLCYPGTLSFFPKIYSLAADSLNEVLAMHWSFGTGQPADTSSAYNPQFTYTSPGVYPVLLSVQSPPGCSSLVSDTVKIASPFTMQTPLNPGICPGGAASLQVQGANSYTWLPDNTLSNIQGGQATARPNTTTTYTVIGMDQYHCFSDTVEVKVVVYPLPTVSIVPVITIPGGSSTVLSPSVSPDVVSWNWSPPDYLSCTTCPSPVSLPSAPVTYTITVTNADGCIASDTVTIRLSCTENAVHIPNAFTPNHDGNNDLFYPVGTGVKLVRYFQVYSRWGQLMFSRKDFPAGDPAYGWDGTLNGTNQPAGTYVFMVGIECFTGETFMLKGTVELLR
jgi:gliding motility-associated-like protein